MVFYLSHSKIYELKRTTLFFFSDLVGLHETFLFTNKNEKKILLQIIDIWETVGDTEV